MIAFEWERRDVVHVEGVWDSVKVLPIHRDDKWFIVVRFINAVQKSKFLERLQDVHGVPKPVGIPSDGPAGVRTSVTRRVRPAL